jgi:hypothetical protein
MYFKNAAIYDIASCYNLEIITIGPAASKNASNHKFGIGKCGYNGFQ